MIQYSTNLTDKQWQVIEKIINTQERKRKHSLRNIMNAILYIESWFDFNGFTDGRIQFANAIES